MASYSGFSHEKWWFSIAMLVYQRVQYRNQMWSSSRVNLEHFVAASQACPKVKEWGGGGPGRIVEGSCAWLKILTSKHQIVWIRLWKSRLRIPTYCNVSLYDYISNYFPIIYPCIFTFASPFWAILFEDSSFKQSESLGLIVHIDSY